MLTTHKKFKTRWHGKMWVQNSGAFTKQPCGWIFTELAYSNTPTENPPHLHFTRSEAVKLRDALTKFIEANK